MAAVYDEYGNYVYDDGSYDVTPTNYYSDTQGATYDFNTPASDADWSGYANLSSPQLTQLFTNNITTPEQGKNLIAKVASKLGDTAANSIKSLIFKPGTEELNPAGLGTAAAAIYGLMGGNKVETGGYNKPIPNLTATSAQIPYAADPNRRPGEAGRQYFTDTQYTAPADAAAAQTAAATQAQGIASTYTPKPAQVNPYEGKFKAQWNPPAPAPATNSAPASGVAQLMPVPVAGSQQFASGGLAAGGFVFPADVVAHFGNDSSSAGLEFLKRELGAKPIKGDGDGMSDSIPTHIDGKEKALVANDEAYIEPHVVKRIGGGDEEKGAERLYAMMERIRKARTGNTEQNKRINPDKFLPTGLAGYASGGEVQKFATGDLVPAAPASSPVSLPAATPLGTSTSSSLSPWAGDYVTGYLGKGQALANAPMQTYGGPLTAGASDLQQQAFAGIGSLAQAGYAPQQYQGGTFGAQEAQQYMNPYISAALNPQLAEMQRQSDIARLSDASRLSKAGAFGGSRQAIMESEGRRNLLEKQGQAIGQGYQTAYDKAMQQFNTEQDRRLGAEKAGEASRQYSAEYGLKSLGELGAMGATQRAITGEGIAADKAQFEEQRDYPFKMVQYQKDLLQGLPITSAATTANTTGVSNLSSQILGLQGLYNQLSKLGQAPATTTTTS